MEGFGSQKVRHFTRRHLLTPAGMAVAVSPFKLLHAAECQTAIGATNSQTHPFSSIKQVSAGLLSVGYVEDGPVDGPAVILLHGWPYDIHSFADVVPLLVLAGYRVIVPYCRGFGTTRFLSEETFRNAQPSVVALDTIALMDALQIQKAAPHPDPVSYRKKFSGRYQHRSVTGGIGHNLPQEAPQAFAQAVIDADRL